MSGTSRPYRRVQRRASNATVRYNTREGLLSRVCCLQPYGVASRAHLQRLPVPPKRALASLGIGWPPRRQSTKTSSRCFLLRCGLAHRSPLRGCGWSRREGVVRTLELERTAIGRDGRGECGGARQLAEHGRNRTQRVVIAVSGQTHCHPTEVDRRGGRLGSGPEQASCEGGLAVHTADARTKLKRLYPSI
jgi:hypothetical protein